MRFLALVYEFNLLQAKATDPHVELEQDEHARLAALARLLEGDRPNTSDRRRMPRLAWPSPLLFTADGGFSSGRILNVSGHGMAISTGKALAVGTSLLLHVSDPQDQVEYHLPARVVWTSGKRGGTTGVAFDGVPSRTETFPQVA